MERGDYNIPRQDCAFSLTYGPILTTGKDIVEFLGNDIYTDKKRIIKDVKICDTTNTFVDCAGNPKFSLPLSDYKYLKYLK